MNTGVCGVVAYRRSRTAQISRSDQVKVISDYSSANYYLLLLWTAAAAAAGATRTLKHNILVQSFTCIVLLSDLLL